MAAKTPRDPVRGGGDHRSDGPPPDGHPSFGRYQGKIPAGHRLRLTMACADADNFEPVELAGPLGLHLFLDPERPSRLELPVQG